MRGLSSLIVSQLIVTLALLAFASWVASGDVQTVIVGAVIGNWFKEGTHLGQQVSERARRQEEVVT